MVYASYLKVCANGGSAGVDRQTIEEFNKDVSCNLYKVWNRMSSGSYFPPVVRTVLIPKKQGGKRPLGIPTVSDRIAQGVVKDYLEPKLEPLFHHSSFGYRSGISAHDALKQCSDNCRDYAWAVDVDIKGFFDNISHEWMMKMLSHHTCDKWVLLYTERWLKAGAQQDDGSIASRLKGTPQGGVISPLLANLYLHHAFDMWMGKYFPSNPFERYADDIIVHCSTRDEAEQLLEAIRHRLQVFELELHPDKTKLVYCKDYRRKEKHEHESFIFLGYSFQPRRKPSVYRQSRQFTVFRAAISCASKAYIRRRIREVFNPRHINRTLEEVAGKLNSRIHGWINYYCKFNRGIALKVFEYLNELVRRWMAEKYKIRSGKALIDYYQEHLRVNKNLFVHWQKGIIY